MPPTYNPGKSFIEVQFPVSKISKESYKERKAVQTQTLTPIGKWWGRKPLILCRAAILGLLIPATNNPVKDREIFLKILTMDDIGLWQRKYQNITIKELCQYLTPNEQEEWLETNSAGTKKKFKRGTSQTDRQKIQKIVFSRMSYDNKISFCKRPEQIEGPTQEAWVEINKHLETHAANLQELVKDLGEQQFGNIPSIGDCFCGGGNIPFEAARLGCDVFASDLNPVAAFLTWASFFILGQGDKDTKKLRIAQEEVIAAVDKEVSEWGIEHNEKGWRAYAYLYCLEVICPECGWKVPLLPTMVVAERMQRIIAEIVPDHAHKRFKIDIKSVSSSEEMHEAKKNGTMIESRMICPNPHCPGHTAPISLDSIRGDSQNGLRLWENEDIIPRDDDVFQERLYAIRWQEIYKDENENQQIRWHFCAPTKHDLENEQKTLTFLKERFDLWQKEGLLPNKIIEDGEKTHELIRTRGWTYWHHLFAPRQLLYHGLLMSYLRKYSEVSIRAGLLLGIGRCCDWNVKLCPWHSGVDLPQHMFYNQAFNTLYNYGVRGLKLLHENWVTQLFFTELKGKLYIAPSDSRDVQNSCNIWITDPPYADAIVYHELSELFLAWYDSQLKSIFPEWYLDSKRALSIRGSGVDFRMGMIQTYRNLTQLMPNNGVQIVMFTHQDASVWADLALILWASGLHVTAAWCIATETDTALKTGNYVKGTVLLILRKQSSTETAFLDEIYPEVESEVKTQLDSMLAIDDKDDPNFGDTDYQLAAYAAALRVLTKYKKIEEIDIEREISRIRQNNEKSPLEVVIENAVKIACDHLVPNGIDSFLWKQLGPEERFYLKGLELESHGEYRIGAYQELARGFGIRSYRDLQESGRANETRLRTASEFRDRYLQDEGFGSSLVRQVLFAIRQTRMENDTSAGKVWLRGLANYWDRRKDIIGILFYVAAIGSSDTMPQWHEDVKSARLLAGAVEQDHI